ncbi:hypothetical protein LBMAG53_28060 [Planctomycetota bacterium]|nr:hypothetical protein LBMAG53_28060 [Planctomycetota bacterium]
MTDCRALLAVSYGRDPHQTFDLVVPERPAAEAVAICLPGGWWSAHPPVGKAQTWTDLRPLLLALANLGIPAAALGHRRLSETARDGSDIIGDVLEGIERIGEEAGLLGLPSRGGVVLVGSGAGSLTALVAAHRLAANPDAGGLLVRGVVAAGITIGLEPGDCSSNLRTICDQFAGPDRSGLSPLALAAAGFPPALLLHGDGDGEVTTKIAMRLHQHLGPEAIFVTLSGAGHQFLDHPLEKAGHIALERTAAFIRDLSRPSADAPLFAGKLA